jgi:lantibiotic modifying enzyme
MINIVARQVLMAYEELNLHVKNFENLKNENPSQKMTEGLCELVLSSLKRSNEIIQRLNLPHSKNRIDYINDYSALFPNAKNVSEVYEMMRGLQADWLATETRRSWSNLSFLSCLL